MSRAKTLIPSPSDALLINVVVATTNCNRIYTSKLDFLHGFVVVALHEILDNITAEWTLCGFLFEKPHASSVLHMPRTGPETDYHSSASDGELEHLSPNRIDWLIRRQTMPRMSFTVLRKRSPGARFFWFFGIMLQSFLSFMPCRHVLSCGALMERFAMPARVFFHQWVKDSGRLN